MQNRFVRQAPWLALILLSCGIFYTSLQHDTHKKTHHIAELTLEVEQEPSVSKSLNPRQEPNSTFQDLLDYAKLHLPQEGTLVSKEDGYVYLKVDNAYIHTLFDKFDLQRFGFRKVPYFRSATSPGAHISVFYSNENVHPEEIGQQFPFSLNEVKVVSANRFKRYLVLQVEAPELEALRRKYDKSPFLQGHPFHISIALKQYRKPHRPSERPDGRSYENRKPFRMAPYRSLQEPS